MGSLSGAHDYRQISPQADLGAASQSSNVERRRQERSPLDSGGDDRHSPETWLLERVNSYNEARRREVGGNLMSRWFSKHDPGGELIFEICNSDMTLLDRAIDAEIKNSKGCAYIAGAAQRATKGEFVAADIMSGRYAAEKATQ